MLTKLPLEKIFKKALTNGGEFADIFFESTAQSTITCDNKRIEKVVSGTDAGIGLRVIHNYKTAYGYTNDLSEVSLLELAGAVSEAVHGKQFNKDINFTKRTPAVTYNVKIRPEGVPLEKKVAIVKRANKAAWGFDKKVQQVSIFYKDSVRNVSIANSLGELTDDEKVDTVFMAQIVASDGKVIQTAYEPIGGFLGLELFDETPPEKVIEAACRRAIIMLSARPAPTGLMPVVLSSEAGGTMVHEAVGHGLEADLADQGFSIYKGRIGETVASPLVTVIDDATLPGRRGSFSFDDEGIPAQRTVLIENGVLKAYMHNRMTAQRANTVSTGNGRRETYKFKPSVRMTNTFIKPGNDDGSSIIKGTDHGLLVKRMGGGQVNTITGDFVFEVVEGYLIKYGKISDPVRGATLTGNGPDVLKKIDKVGSDLGFALGTCGKDDQGVPVGHAQPTLHIPEIIIGGREEK